jgi:hypothetical protein
VAGNPTRRIFSKEQVLSIRDPKNNLSLYVLARMYSVSPHTIWSIRKGETYKDVEIPR